MAKATDLKQSSLPELCARLSEGRGLANVCRDADMPSVRSVQVWISEDEEYAAQITRAREIGYLIRAERAVEDAKVAEDASKGRLAFDAERWYLGKLSNAFTDNPTRKQETQFSLSPEAAEWLGQ